MTVSSTSNRKSYAGDAVTSSFATSPVVFFDTTDLAVYIVTESTGAVATLVENTDYSVTGGSGSTGTVDLSGGSSPYGAPASGETLVIVRTLPLTQGTDLVNNDTLDAEVVEDVFDKGILIDQQLSAKFDRSVSRADSDTATGSLTIPALAASAALGLDAQGNITTYAVTSAVTAAENVTFTPSGIGASARTVQAKEREVQLSLNDFTTDAQALSAGITAGKAVTATDGTYDFTGVTATSVSSDLILVAQNDATISATTSDDLLRAAGGNIILVGHDFDAWSHVVYSPQTDSGYTTSYLHSERSLYANMFDAFYVERPLSEAMILFNRFDTLTGVPIKFGYNNYSLQDDWTDFKIIGNRANNLVLASAIDTYLAQIDGKRHIVALNTADTITGNTTGNTWGIYTKMRWGTILGNIITNISTAGSTNPAAFQIKGAGRGDTANGTQGYSNIIANNLAYGAGSADRGFETHVEDTLFVGNLLENFVYGGYIAQPTAGEQRVLVAANKFIGPAASSGNYCIYENSTADDVSIIGNVARTAERGIYSAGTGVRNRQIVANNITDCSGIAIQQSGTQDLVSIVGNQVDGATKAAYVAGSITRFLAVANNWDGLTGAADQQFQIDGGVKSGVMMANAPHEVDTANATATDLFRLQIPTNARVSIKLTVMAVDSASAEDGTWFIQGTFYNNAGTATQRGSTTSLMTAVTSSWGGSVPTGPAFRVSSGYVIGTVTGKASTDIRWSMLPEVQWLTYA